MIEIIQSTPILEFQVGVKPKKSGVQTAHRLLRLTGFHLLNMETQSCVEQILPFFLGYLLDE